MGQTNTFLGTIRKNKDRCLVVMLSIFSCILYLAPSNSQTDTSYKKVVARVIAVDNSQVETYGVVQQGDQSLKVEIEDQAYDAKEHTVYNALLGDPELDWMFKPGEKAYVSIRERDDKITLQLLGPYRLGAEKVLGIIFLLLLIVVAGWVGAKAVLSFVFAVLLIWKALVPLCLMGYNPILVSLIVVACLTGAITFLIGGLTRRGSIAFLGGFLGLLTTYALAELFVPSFYLTGTARPFAKAVIFSNPNINLYRFFIAGIFIASSGAVMDLAMDIATAMQEIKEHKPHITRSELFKSGMKVGQAVVGTMTTTLLLAYSGGYMMMLVYFVSQNISVDIMLNSTYFSTEILSTLVGSFGLVTVAPFSALVGSIIFTFKTDDERSQN